ncbi:MAG: hypothetical protein ACFFFH_10135 [Candidatus Thorarchaeota archaeon]
MFITINAKIITPIITKKTIFKVDDCRAVILKPKKRYITKSHKKLRIYPYSFIGYLGILQLTFKANSFEKAKGKIQNLLYIESIDRLGCEGMGRIQWLNGKINQRIRKKKQTHYNVRIRKNLPHYLPEEVKNLLRYSLLHDFAHTSKHRSKIYVEPDIQGIEELRKHHNKTENKLILQFQKYDRISASRTRTIHSPRKTRYTWNSIGLFDFNRISNEIKEVSDNIWKLYQYIHESEELNQLNESLYFGHLSLRYHLLLIANLIVRDYLRGNLRELTHTL